jgi:two-component system LytT family sensor kinase
MTNPSLQKIKTPFAKHLLFWLAVYGAYFITANWTFYQNVTQVAEMYFMMTCLQIIVAYTTLNFLIPKFLNKKKIVVFICLEIVVLVSVVACYHYGKTLYFYPKYPDLFAEQIRIFGYLPLWERVANLPVTLSKSVFYLSPTIVLLLFRFYKNQQKLLKLNEQKKTAELTALKHQLNPHFLFNTLNNLYALAIKKSDQTPEVIEKLSNILDYMLGSIVNLGIECNS